MFKRWLTEYYCFNLYSQHTYDCGVMLPILQGYVMKTVGVTQMPVRYEAPLVLSHSHIEIWIDLENTTEEDRPG